MTLLAAPWLLRQGQHIRVDIVLRALPRALAWLLRMGRRRRSASSAASISSWYGAGVAAESYASGALSIKTLIMPEWWMLAPLPVCLRAARDRVRVPHAPARRMRRAGRATTPCRAA